MQSTYANEKRSEKRYEGVYAEYAFIQENEDYRFVDAKTCFLRNFSFGGACLHVYEPVPERASIYLKLYDPNSTTPIDIVGRIVWYAHVGSGGGPNARLQHNVGVQFMHVNENNRRRLVLLVDHFESLIPKRKGPIDYR